MRTLGESLPFSGSQFPYLWDKKKSQLGDGLVHFLLWLSMHLWQNHIKYKPVSEKSERLVGTETQHFVWLFFSRKQGPSFSPAWQPQLRLQNLIQVFHDKVGVMLRRKGGVRERGEFRVSQGLSNCIPTHACSLELLRELHSDSFVVGGFACSF